MHIGVVSVEARRGHQIPWSRSDYVTMDVLGTGPLEDRTS